VFLAAAALFLLYRVRGVLAPFILAFALSIPDEPGCHAFGKTRRSTRFRNPRYLRRVHSCHTLFVLYLVPKFLVQLERLGEVLPQQAGSIQSEIAGFYKRFSRFNIPEPVKGAIDNGIDRAEEALAGFIERTLGSVPGLLPRLSLLILVPVLAFYLTMDFPELKMWLLSWIPDRWRSDIVGLMIEMDNSLGSFIRGQLLISAIVGVLIAVGLSIIGVDFALIIGLIAGIST